MRNYLVLVCAVAFAAGAVAQAPKSPQKPGKWQIKVETDMPGLPMKIPPVTTDVCLTEADLADPQKAVPKDAKSDCKVTDYKVAGNTATWAVDCPSQKMKGTGEATYSGDSYTMVTKMKMDGQDMSAKYTGKWLGTCTK
jgi:Protein of unknown function (DUF3617)